MYKIRGFGLKGMGRTFKLVVQLLIGFSSLGANL